MLTIIKRDGREVQHDRHKIFVAISKAFKECGYTDLAFAEQYSKDIDDILHRNPNKTKWSVEEIQDIVEQFLIDRGRGDVAKAYIIYRKQRSDIRHMKSVEHRLVNDLLTVDAADMDAKRENANIDADATMGTMLKIGGTITREFALRSLIKPKHSQYHREGRWHIHDLDFFALCPNCCQIPLRKLLDHGFSTGHGYLRTPSTIQSAATLVCIIIQSSQNDFFGGQSIPMLDYDLAPYVAKSFVRNMLLAAEGKYPDLLDDEEYHIAAKKIKEECDAVIAVHRGIMDDDAASILKGIFTQYLGRNEENYNDLLHFAKKKTKRDCEQAMEGLVHNLCTLQSRSGGQVPFSSVNFGTDTSPEGRLVIHSILWAIDCGLGNGETAIFPISIFKMKKGKNRKGDPNYDLFQEACRVSARRLFPNFTCLDAPYNLQYYKEGHPETEMGVMGCVRAQDWVNLRYPGKDYTYTICDMVSFGTLYEQCKDRKWIKASERSEYLEINGEWTVYDSSRDDYVKVRRFIHNTGVTNWRLVTFNNHIQVGYTGDHPLPIAGKGRTNVDDLKVGDSIDRDPFHYTVTKIEDKGSEFGDSFDFETESDHLDICGIPSFNCRTRVLGNEYDPDQQVTPGRGNLFPLTLNLPFAALEVREKLSGSPMGPVDRDDLLQEFYKHIDQLMEDAFDMLDDRLEIVGRRKAKNYPFSMCQHLYIDSEKLGPDDPIIDVLKHGTLTVGFIGLAECLTVLTGAHHGESEESWQIGLAIIKHMNDICAARSKEKHLNYTLMGSPAEGCCGRLASATRKRFGKIKGVTDRAYLVNSSHIPPWFEISAFEKVRREAPFHQYCPAGCIAYAEMDGNISNNPEAFQTLIEYMADSNMNYFAINHPVDRDPVCGFIGHIGDTCPRCGRREGEGVTVEKLLSLSTYQPDPQYAVKASMLDEERDTIPNSYDQEMK